MPYDAAKSKKLIAETDRHPHIANHAEVARRNQLQQADDEVERLREWIAAEGCRTDTCTHDVLGAICDGCKCARRFWGEKA